MLTADKNLLISQDLPEKDVAFYNVKEKPFDVYGTYKKEIGRQFLRMDPDVALTVSQGVYNTSKVTAGGRIRFKTNSPYVVVSLEFEGTNGKWPQMSGLAVNGCDMYEIVEGKQEFVGSFIPPYGSDGTYQQLVYFLTDLEEHDVVLNMPTYAQVDEFYVGVKEGSTIKGGSKYKNELPVIFYGSSITQGGCMARPGMIYENILSRKYNMNYHNLGFGGNAKGEKEIAEYIANQDMCMFVYDYDYNTPSPEHLTETHERMFKIVREKHPDIPIIILSAVSGRNMETVYKRRDIIKKTYENAVEGGDKNVYFIDGSTIFTKNGYGWNEPTIEGCHPSDLGFALMAKEIGEVIDKNNLF